MPYFLASYDLEASEPSPYTSFREQGERLKWQTAWTVEGVTKSLPNTTMFGQFASHDAAAQSLEAVRAATAASMGVAVRITRSIIVDFTAAIVVDNKRVGLGGLLGIGSPLR